MISILVFAFSHESGADRMIADMQSMQEKHFITISDAATVIRKPDGMIKIKHINNLDGSSALGGVFWGLLIGQVFFMPWLGLSIGASRDSLAGKFADYGISNRFVKEVGTTIMPGHSALFLMVTSVIEDRVIEVLSRHKATLLRTNLSSEDEIILREAFGSTEV
jgi:uncharacterized membrane protein